MLLIMGLSAQMVYWDEGFIDQLVQRGFRVIRFDNRDVGRSTHLHAAEVPSQAPASQGPTSGRPPEAPYLLSDMAADDVEHGRLEPAGSQARADVPVPTAALRKRVALSHDRCYDPAGYARQQAAMTASGSRKQALASVRAPTLVIHGKEDPAAPMGHDLPREVWPRIAEAIAANAARAPGRSSTTG